MTSTPRVDWRSLAGLAAVIVVVWGISSWARHANEQGLSAQLAAQVRPGDIEMVSSTTCVVCKRARGWFTRHQVPFDECFIETEARCAQRFTALGGVGTPTFVVRGQRIVGFDRERMVAVLSGRDAASPVR
jgi:glutaredoxin